MPDAIPGIFDFTDACATHDECYASGQQTRPVPRVLPAGHGRHRRRPYPSAHDARRYLCLTFTQLYFFGVRLLGQLFF